MNPASGFVEYFEFVLGIGLKKYVTRFHRFRENGRSGLTNCSQIVGARLVTQNFFQVGGLLAQLLEAFLLSKFSRVGWRQTCPRGWLFSRKAKAKSRRLCRRRRFCHGGSGIFCSCIRGRRVGRVLFWDRSEEHTSELQSHLNLVCR